jgi:hypothetical protein
MFRQVTLEKHKMLSKEGGTLTLQFLIVTPIDAAIL